ncbi:BolA family protein [Saccharospirillum sp.]|uniref:BolA family protein n=1 Tax=Saccharospirillum sp. TaxID=2033801 RepID=UPI0034A03E25
MSADEVKALLAAAFPGATVEVDGGGAKFTVRVIDDAFSGKRPVQRQQRVYGVLNEKITSGDIHAVSMALFTSEEWSDQEK